MTATEIPSLGTPRSNVSVASKWVVPQSATAPLQAAVAAGSYDASWISQDAQIPVIDRGTTLLVRMRYLVADQAAIAAGAPCKVQAFGIDNKLTQVPIKLHDAAGVYEQTLAAKTTDVRYNTYAATDAVELDMEACEAVVVAASQVPAVTANVFLEVKVK